MGEDVFDHVLVNVQRPPEELIEVYASEGELVENDLVGERVILAHLLGRVASLTKGDPLKRNLIRHDSKQLAQELMQVVHNL